MPSDLTVVRLLASEEGRRAAGDALDESYKPNPENELAVFLRSLASTECGRGWLAALAFPGEELATIHVIRRAGANEAQATISAALELSQPA